MARHCGMQWRCSRNKAYFSIILSWNVPHKLSHCVSVIVGRSECVFSYKPSGRKYYKITSCLAWIFSLRCQNCEDGRIWMVIRYGADSVELSQIILVWSVVSMPGYYIKGRVMLFILEELSLELINHCPLIILVFKPRYRGLKISRIG